MKRIELEKLVKYVESKVRQHYLEAQRKLNPHPPPPAPSASSSAATGAKGNSGGGGVGKTQRRRKWESDGDSSCVNSAVNQMTIGTSEEIKRILVKRKAAAAAAAAAAAETSTAGEEAAIEGDVVGQVGLGGEEPEGEDDDDADASNSESLRQRRSYPDFPWMVAFEPRMNHRVEIRSTTSLYSQNDDASADGARGTTGNGDEKVRGVRGGQERDEDGTDADVEDEAGGQAGTKGSPRYPKGAQRKGRKRRLVRLPLRWNPPSHRRRSLLTLYSCARWAAAKTMKA